MFIEIIALLGAVTDHWKTNVLIPVLYNAEKKDKKNVIPNVWHQIQTTFILDNFGVKSKKCEGI